MKHFWSVGILLSIAPAIAWSCSPWQEVPFQLEAAAESGELVPTAAPTARVVEVSRGRRTGRGENTCSELASVSIAVRDDSPGRPYVFAFERVAGDAPDEIFFSGLYTGQSNGNGEQVFHFHRPELEAQPKPFEVTVKITPHSRSGTAGPSTVLVVRNGL
jgi:hypothetical protein